MVIITKSKINDFINQHPAAANALDTWYKICKDSSWKNHAALKDIFLSADYIGNERYVFNIKGNEYRLIAMIHFDIRTMYIRFIGTHEEYNKIDCFKI